MVSATIYILLLRQRHGNPVRKQRYGDGYLGVSVSECAYGYVHQKPKKTSPRHRARVSATCRKEALRGSTASKQFTQGILAVYLTHLDMTSLEFDLTLKMT